MQLTNASESLHDLSRKKFDTSGFDLPKIRQIEKLKRSNCDMDLEKLSTPFSSQDIEWRVTRSGPKGDGVYAVVVAYITARAIQARLDEVCGPQNWKLEEPLMLDLGRDSKANETRAFACGISVRLESEWITKWDVAEPTNIEAAKGGWSGAMKRSGAQWGIGRYLYHMTEVWAETSDRPGLVGDAWNYATLSAKHDYQKYYWKTPELPAWALPKELADKVVLGDLAEMKKAWKSVFAPDETNKATLSKGFERFVLSTCGKFPVDDPACWTVEACDKVRAKIAAGSDLEGVDSDVPFS